MRMSNNKPRQVYTSAFKREAIELARTSGKPVTELVPRGHPELGLRQGAAQVLDPAGQNGGRDSFSRTGTFKAYR
jgi:transposase-like protein